MFRVRGRRGCERAHQEGDGAGQGIEMPASYETKSDGRGLQSSTFQLNVSAS